MQMRQPGFAALFLSVAFVITGLTGCGHAASTEPQVPPARMEHIGPGDALSVVLTPLGASRIAIKTAPAIADGQLVVVPYGALLYEPDGQTAVYVKVTGLIYTRRFVTVGTINGNDVMLTGGLQPGIVVVTQGGEELLGVQNGVGVET
jgi:multidrug efflux pump subunit AcrA (membrane-fusion protein)